MRYQPLHLCRLRHQRFSIARRSLIFRVITTTTPIRNGKTNVAKRYNRDAEPAMPVPTIPANNPVNTNSVEPIPAGAGITAASITDNAVIAMVSTRLIFLSPAKEGTAFHTRSRALTGLSRSHRRPFSSCAEDI